MAVKSCMRTCIDDCIRLMAFCQLLAGAAAFVFVGRMMYADNFFSSGDWKHPNATWFIYAVSAYGLLMVLSGFLGLFGLSTCKGFCLDSHALLSLVLLAVEGVVVALYVIDREALEHLAKKDAVGYFDSVLKWISANQVGSVAIVATLAGIQALCFVLSWSVRLCCASYGYRPVPNQYDVEYAAIRPEVRHAEADRIRQKYQGQRRNEFIEPLLDDQIAAIEGQNSRMTPPSAPTFK